MLWTVSFRRTKGATLEHTTIAVDTSARAWLSLPYWLLGAEIPDYYSAEVYPVPLGEVFDLGTLDATQVK